MGLEAPIVEVSEKRRARRRTTGARVGVRPLGKQRVETRLLDISRYGFRVAAERLTPGSSVWLKLADSEPQTARVVWSAQYASGCVFLDPLDRSEARRVGKECVSKCRSRCAPAP